MGRRRDPQVDPTTKPPSGYLESPLQCAIFALNRKRQGQQQQKILHCTTQERTSTTALSTFPYRSMKSRQTVLPRHHTSSVNGCPARFALEFDACRAYRAKCKRGITRLPTGPSPGPVSSGSRPVVSPGSWAWAQLAQSQDPSLASSGSQTGPSQLRVPARAQTTHGPSIQSRRSSSLLVKMSRGYGKVKG